MVLCIDLAEHSEKFFRTLGGIFYFIETATRKKVKTE